MPIEKDKDNRPLAYPKPSVTDQQLNNQPEFVDPQPNSTGEEELDGKPELKEYPQKDNGGNDN
ncbi:MAG: hypothetical protein M3413_02505 [Bacteroidota bacterium]|jgi:hypothetical protein|nr:hypothetical protein [Flavisolibacter sp.]MDQ3550372.1 hypothetical protein [Bacteroidota bacterium]